MVDYLDPKPLKKKFSQKEREKLASVYVMCFLAIMLAIIVKLFILAEPWAPADITPTPGVGESTMEVSDEPTKTY